MEVKRVSSPDEDGEQPRKIAKEHDGDEKLDELAKHERSKEDRQKRRNAEREREKR